MMIHAEDIGRAWAMILGFVAAGRGFLIVGDRKQEIDRAWTLQSFADGYHLARWRQATHLDRHAN